MKNLKNALIHGDEKMKCIHLLDNKNKKGFRYSVIGMGRICEVNLLNKICEHYHWL